MYMYTPPLPVCVGGGVRQYDASAPRGLICVPLFLQRVEDRPHEEASLELAARAEARERRVLKRNRNEDSGSQVALTSDLWRGRLCIGQPALLSRLSLNHILLLKSSNFS